jgi:hypothetical protein
VQKKVGRRKKVNFAKGEFRASAQESWTTAGRWLALAFQLLVWGLGPAGD